MIYGEVEVKDLFVANGKRLPENGLGCKKFLKEQIKYYLQSLLYVILDHHLHCSFF